ncbi:unnamed protein product [Closterium sp. NIES-53]
MAFASFTIANPITPLRLEVGGNSSNYKAWSYEVDKHLLSHEVQGLDLKDVLLNYGKGKEPPPPPPPMKPTETTNDAATREYEEAVDKYRRWEKADAAIISIFIGTPLDIVNTYHKYLTSNAIWKHLHDRFRNKTAVGVDILIPSMFRARLEDSLGMADFIAKVQTIHGELKELGIVFPEQAPAAALLVGLTLAYEVTRKMLLTLLAADLTFAKVSSALLSAEKDAMAQAKTYALRGPVPQASVTLAPFQRNRFPPCTYVVKYGNFKGQVCGGTNHPFANCFKKKDDEWYAVHGVDKKPPNWMRSCKLNQVEAQEPAQASAPANVHLNMLFLGTALILNLGSSHTPNLIEFTLDSGATHTVLKEKHSFQPFSASISLLGADSSFTTHAMGSPTVMCPAFPSGTVTGMYVPSLRHNLCDILDPLTKKLLAHFTLNSSDLYTLRLSAPQVSTTQAQATVTPCSRRSLANPTILYHHWLGQPNFRTLADMASKKLLLGLPASLPPPPDSPAPTCCDCTKSKLRKQPHLASPSVAAAPLDLVHIDVWGPNPVAARGGHRYFLSIVDDHSCYVSMHLLHTKAKAPKTIMAWVRHAHVTFGTKVKCLHSDGGDEFCNSKLEAFCSSLGIQQNFTLPDTP